jgi:type II secretory pathway component GspD/PulD (secretin)
MSLSAALHPIAIVLALLAGDDPTQTAAPPASTPVETAATSTFTERLVYPIRYGSAGDVAKVLDQYFHGSAEIQALPEKTGNCLFVRYRPSLRDELIKTLAELDQPPKTVAIDVLLIDLAKKKEKVPEGEVPPGRPGAAKAEQAVPPLKDGELAGPTADVIARVDALLGSGGIAALRKVHIAALENQQATAQSGREVPMPANFQFNQRTGNISPILQRRSIGTIVSVTPRVVSDNEIQLDVVVREDRIYVPDDAKPVGKDEKGPVVLPNVSTTNATGKITVKPGRTLILQQLPSDEKGDSEKILIVVAAEVVNGNARENGK